MMLFNNQFEIFLKILPSGLDGTDTFMEPDNLT
jgi:hypothetical protein